MSTYLERVLNGDVPTMQEWNDHLRTFHRAYPSATPFFLNGLCTSGGETTYEYTARRLHEEAPGARAVLELGCGDGTLLREIGRRYAGTARLAGIDISEESLALAREALPGAELVCDDAAQASMGTSAYDAVVAHLSLLAMGRSEIVMATVHRALTPSGTFLAVIEDPASNDTVMQLMIAAVRAVAKRTPHFGMPVPQRPALERDDALIALLENAGFSARIERFELRAVFTPDQLSELVCHSYALALLNGSLLDHAATAVREQARLLSHGAEIDARLMFRIVIASKDSLVAP